MPPRKHCPANALASGCNDASYSLIQVTAAQLVAKSYGEEEKNKRNWLNKDKTCVCIWLSPPHLRHRLDLHYLPCKS